MPPQAFQTASLSKRETSAVSTTVNVVAFPSQTQHRCLSCHNRRISTHRVFANYAGRSKPLWGGSIKSTLNARMAFNGFKLHHDINDQGELLSVMVTAGNVDDRKPVPQLCQGLFGKVFADKGYIGKNLRETLQEDGVALIYKVRPNMEPEPISEIDAALLKQRMLIESVNKKLKS